jgi:hypothetical protein
MEWWMSTDPFLLAGLVTAAISVVLLLWYLVRRPVLNRTTKLVLLAGIGIFPIATATNGNVAGYNATKSVRFCTTGCHVMNPYGDDVRDLASESLASRHSRNAAFGDESCYACHADYGMFGTVTTKMGGMRHVYEYLTHYHSVPISESLVTIELVKPFKNDACTRCHSMQTPLWNSVGDHASSLADVQAGVVSCASEGCHGFAHPFSKQAKRAAGVLP